MSRARPSVRPPSRFQRKKGDEDVTAAQASWSVLTGNVSVISREFHNLSAVPGGEITEWHIVSGNVPVVSLALWKLRQMKTAEEESERLPGDWTARIDPTTQRTYYYSRSLKKTQWTVPVNEDGSGAPTPGGAGAGAGAGAGTGAGAGAASKGSENGGSGGTTGSEPVFVDPADGKAYDWVEKLDTASGRKYFFSPARHKTQWHAPSKVRGNLETKDDWVEKRAPNGRPYYFSPSRNITSWQKPAGAHTNPTGRSHAAKKAAELNEHGLPGDWRPVVSKSSGKTYYHSKSLNKTMWTKPEPEPEAEAEAGAEAATEAEAATASGSATAAAGAPVAAAAPVPPTKPVASGDDVADLFGNAAAVAPPPAPAHAKAGDVSDRVPSFRDPTDPRYIPSEAPPDPDAPPSLTQAEDEPMTTEYDFEGYLMKKGGGKRLFGRKNWQKRYFVMIDAQLAYFKSQEAYEGGQQPLKGTWISVAKYELEEGDDDLSFSLEPKKGEDVERNRGFALRALTEDDRDAWMEKITEAAKYDLLLARQEAEEAARRAEAGEPEYDYDDDEDDSEDDY